ncbi:MAG: M20/M25/M40 family metallo-hydrolase [Chloroflexota bacterium]
MATVTETNINKSRLVETFVDLIKINSPSFDEREIGTLLRMKLAALGCDIELQDYGPSFNLIARKKATDAALIPFLLNAHMDTIEPTEGIKFDAASEVIRSTGTTVLGADDKCALAQIIEALTVVGECSIPHGDIEIVFTSAEEKGLLGARNLDFATLRSKHALVLDSGGAVGRIVIGAPMHVTYTMLISGRSAHAGIEPERGISAIRAAASLITKVPDGRIDDETTANIGLISGGTATNVVPRETTVRGEVRSHSRKTLEHVRHSIFDLARAVVQAHGATLSISEQEEYTSFRINENDPFLGYLEEVFTRCGIAPSRVLTGGGSDANIFNHRGITALNISTGMQKVHSVEEEISVRDLCLGSLVVAQAISNLGMLSRAAGP